LSLLKKYFGDEESHVIFAADRPSLEENLAVLAEIREAIDVIKVPTFLALTEGVRVYGRLSDTFGLPVFADLKIADVPHTNGEIVRVARESGAAGVMVHAFVGPDGLSAALDAAKGAVAVIAQLELTSPGGEVFNAPISDALATLSSGMGVDGVQAPGNRPERIRRIRQIVGKEIGIVCCGVGVQGGQFEEVMDAGANYAIIGRAIYQSEHPLEALAGIVRRA
jgi:orotidine-5'-phosphate decarboxylase